MKMKLKLEDMLRADCRIAGADLPSGVTGTAVAIPPNVSDQALRKLTTVVGKKLMSIDAKAGHLILMFADKEA